MLKTAVASMPPATSGDVTPLPPVLSAVRAAAQPAGFPVATPPLSMSLGLYQGDKLDAGGRRWATRRLLEHALHAACRAPARGASARRQQGQPRARLRGLKTYLMLYTPDKFDADALKAWIRRRLGRGASSAAWRRSSAQALDEHLDALLAGARRAPAAPMDKGLVAACATCWSPIRSSTASSAASSAQVGGDIPPFTVGRCGRTVRAAGVRARQRRAADQGHPGPLHP